MFNYNFKRILRILVPFFLLFVILTGGTVGYMIIENYTFAEALFMTIITISTVGFSLIKPLSQNGIIFTSILIISSFGIFAYSVSSITTYIFGGDFQRILKKRKMKNEFKRIKNHVIVCGFGRNGRQAAIELLNDNDLVIVIEKRESVINEHQDLHKNLNFIHGESIQEEFLIKAKVKEAKALIATLPSDANNLFVVLTAREFNKKMTIISRATDEHSDVKLKLAGATNVIMPDKVGGTRMAKLVSHPDIVEFLENLMLKTGDTVNIEEIKCSDLPSCLLDKAIKDIEIRKKSGANIIGIKLENGSYIFNPSPSYLLTKNIMLFVLGNPIQIKNFKNILANYE